MIFDLFLILSISIIGYSLAVLIQKKGIATESTKIFVIFTYFLITWIVVTLFEDPNIFREKTIWFLVQVDYIIASSLPYFFFLFCLSFPRRITKHSSSKKILLLLPTLFFTFLVPVGPVVKDVAISNQTVNILAGKFYFLYAAYIFIYFSAAFSSLILKYRSSKGLQRTQISYLLLGLSLSAIVIVATNLFVPYIPHVAQFSKLGLYSVFFFLGFTTYTILRYRLMDIRVVIRRGAIEVFTVLTLLLLYSFPIFLIVNFIEKTRLIVIGIGLFIIAFLFLRPLRAFYEKIANKYFFTELYQSEKILKGMAQKLSSIIELDKLLALITDTISESLRPEKIGILIFNSEKETFELKKSINFREEEIPPLTKENVFIKYLFTLREPLVLSEIKLQIMKEKDKKKKETLKRVELEMEKMDIALVLPLITKDILSGVVILSKKISERPYSKEDLSLLVPLTSQASIAIANAQLYDETKKRRDELEKFYKVTVGRELRMAELKKEIERLKAEKKKDIL